MHRLFTGNLSQLFISLAFAILIGPVAPAIAQTPMATPVAEAPSFRESECMYELPDGLTEDDFVCGWVTAQMYPDGSKAGTVELPVIRVLATTNNPAPEPLMILLGGPGQNMSAVLPTFGDEMPLWRFMLEQQDVILFDQRGMGQSVPTALCPFERAVDGSGVPESDMALGLSILSCGAQLKKEGLDVTAFTTQNNAADIEAIRIAMGYDQIDLYGISYGSKLALSAIRDYPDSIRATIISSPLPLEQNPFLDQTVGFDNSLKLVWDECATDAQCAADNPDPAGAYVQAVERLKTEPMNVRALDPGTGEEIDIEIDNIQFMQVLYLGVFIGPYVPILPYLVTSVAAGNDAVLQTFAPILLMGGGTSIGALFTYFCQDEAPFSPTSETNAALKEADLASPMTDGSWISLGDQTYQLCPMWKFPPADPIESEAVVSDEPLLILTGTYDPITPSSNGERVANNFPNSQLVNFESQGHDPASYVPECSNAMITGFLDDPTAPVDASCAAVPVEFHSLEEILELNATPAATPLVDPGSGN